MKTIRIIKIKKILSLLTALCALSLTACNDLGRVEITLPPQSSIDDTSIDGTSGSDLSSDISSQEQTAPPDSSSEDITDSTEFADDSSNEQPADDDARFTLTFGGDTCLDGYYGSFADTVLGWAGLDYPFADVKPIFEASDYTIVNLETAVSDRGESEKRAGFGFRTPPEVLSSFSNAGIDMMCLANNHLRDFGVIGVEDTLMHLADNGFDYVGAGYSYDEARECKIIEKNGIKVGFLAYNCFVSSPDWLAGDNRAGMAAWTADTYADYLEDIEKYDKECDVLVVSAHWGVEETYEISSQQEELGRLFVDYGADLVIGHHPHVVQGVEYYKNVPIYYSVGNLLFYKLEDDLDGLSAVFEVTFDRQGVVSARVYPIFIGSYKAQLLSENSERYNHILSALGMCSFEYGVGVDGQGNLIFDYDGDKPLLEPVELVGIDLEEIRS